MHYDLLINVTRGKYDDGYIADTARLVLTYSGEVGDQNTRMSDALHDIYARHNRDDRPDGKLGPSLSCGDVIHLVGEGYFAVGPDIDYSDPGRPFVTRGFEEIVAPDEIINDRTWSEVHREED